MANSIKIKNRSGKILGQIVFDLPNIDIDSDDRRLKEIIDQAMSRGVRIMGHDKDGVIAKDSPLFYAALSDHLRMRGYVVDGWDDYRNKIRAELADYPQEDEFVKTTLSRLEHMSKLELSYLLNLLTAKEL